jgi:hypothetical protein
VGHSSLPNLYRKLELTTVPKRKGLSQVTRRKETDAQVRRRIEKELAMPHVQDRIAYDRWRAVFEPKCGDDFIWNPPTTENKR